MSNNYINQLKEQLTVELEHFIVEPNNIRILLINLMGKGII